MWGEGARRLPWAMGTTTPPHPPAPHAVNAHPRVRDSAEDKVGGRREKGELKRKKTKQKNHTHTYKGKKKKGNDV